MRHFAFLAFALLATPAIAQDLSDPKSVVEALYANYGPAQIYPDPITHLRSERLNALYEADAKEADGEIGRIDFDPFINAQDYELSKLEIGDPYLAGGKAVVRVRFENMGTANEVGILLVNEGGDWKIDDVWNGGDEYSYDLLDILRAPLP